MAKTSKQIRSLSQAAALGRHGDSILVHMDPAEAALGAEMQGGYSINPATGLYEFFSFKKALKSVAKAAGAVVGGYFGGPAGAAIGAGAATKLTGGSWKDAIGTGLISGIGAYGVQQSGLTGDWGGGFDSGTGLLGQSGVDTASEGRIGSVSGDWSGLGGSAGGGGDGFSISKVLPIAGIAAAGLAAGTPKIQQQDMPQPVAQNDPNAGPDWSQYQPLNRDQQGYPGDYLTYGQGSPEYSFYDQVNPADDIQKKKRGGKIVKGIAHFAEGGGPGSGSHDSNHDSGGGSNGGGNSGGGGGGVSGHANGAGPGTGTSSNSGPGGNASTAGGGTKSSPEGGGGSLGSEHNPANDHGLAGSGDTSHDNMDRDRLGEDPSMGSTVSLGGVSTSANNMNKAQQELDHPGVLGTIGNALKGLIGLSPTNPSIDDPNIDIDPAKNPAMTGLPNESFDPTKAALALGGFFSPIGAIASLAYSGARQIGIRGPTVNLGPGIGSATPSISPGSMGALSGPSVSAKGNTGNANNGGGYGVATPGQVNSISQVASSSAPSSQPVPNFNGAQSAPGGGRQYLGLNEDPYTYGQGPENQFWTPYNFADGGKAKGQTKLSPDDEAKFESDMQTNPWAEEFPMRYGEPADLNNPVYDLRRAWQLGIQPSRDVYDSTGPKDPGAYHWPDFATNGEQMKSNDHPTLWMGKFENQTGINPEELGIKTPQDAAVWINQNMNRGMKAGGDVPGPVKGISGFQGPVVGPGGGQADLIPAMLANGEHVWDADIVSAIGDGSNDEGHKKIEAMKAAIRKQKRSAPVNKIPPKTKALSSYLQSRAA